MKFISDSVFSKHYIYARQDLAYDKMRETEKNIKS